MSQATTGRPRNTAPAAQPHGRPSRSLPQRASSRPARRPSAYWASLAAISPPARKAAPNQTPAVSGTYTAQFEGSAGMAPVRANSRAIQRCTRRASKLSSGNSASGRGSSASRVKKPGQSHVREPEDAA